MSQLSKNLKTFRVKSGLTQLEMADLIGISDKNWSNYERGKTEPNVETLLKIASVFKISLDGLVSRDVSLIADSLIEKRHENESLNVSLHESLNLVNESNQPYDTSRMKADESLVIVPYNRLNSLTLRINDVESRLNELEQNKGIPPKK